MKILIYPALMEIGGSQTNAIELAHGVAALGHEVVLFGPDGVLRDVVRNLGLHYVLAPQERVWPSRPNMSALRRLVRDEGIDVVHGYEWGPTMDLALGPHLHEGIPLVSTVMSMSVPDFLPRHVPLIVGTAELKREHAAGHRRLYLMEPPIDTQRNLPGDSAMARTRFGFDEGDFVVVVVGRLVSDLQKVQGVLAAISAVDKLAGSLPIRLLVVGEGHGAADVRRHAQAVNTRRGRDVVVVAGALLDPREAYDAANVVLGMGSSALKGLAFAKPVVVQGAAGFWKLFDDSTLPYFLEQGWYGSGGGGSPELGEILRGLYRDPVRRTALGIRGRALVIDRFSLAQASEDLVRIYTQALGAPASRLRSRASVSVSLARFVKFKFALVRQRWAARSAPRSVWGTS